VGGWDAQLKHWLLAYGEYVKDNNNIVSVLMRVLAYGEYVKDNKHSECFDEGTLTGNRHGYQQSLVLLRPAKNHR
jgi:hypothetical protein